MSLPEIRFQFRVTLSDSERRVAISDQLLSLSLHPSETLERLYLRLLAWALFYRPGLTFGPGLSEPDAPALYENDLTGRRIVWIAVNPASAEKVQFAVRHNKGAEIGAAFGGDSEYERFLESSRGLKQLEEVELVKIDGKLLAELATHEERRYEITITVVEEYLYLELKGSRAGHPGAFAPTEAPVHHFNGTFARSTGLFPPGANAPERHYR